MAKKGLLDNDYIGHLGATLHFIFTFIALVFLSVGAPLGILQDRDSQKCVTLWGIRDSCWKADYMWRIVEETCHDRRRRFEAGEAFIVVALFSLLIQLLFTFNQLSGSSYVKMLVLVISVFTIGCTTVPWAVTVSFYFTNYCGETSFTKESYKYGNGFIMMVVSFSVQGFSLLLFTFLEPSEEKCNKRKELMAQREAERRAKEEAEANASSSDEEPAEKKKESSSSSSSSSKKSSKNDE